MYESYISAMGTSREPVFVLSLEHTAETILRGFSKVTGSPLPDILMP